MRVMAGALEGDLFIGPKAEVTVPKLSLSVIDLAGDQSNLFLSVPSWASYLQFSVCVFVCVCVCV